MLLLFKRLRSKLLRESKIGAYLAYALGEIVLVVIGILIALSVNNWNSGRRSNTLQKEYIRSLINDVNSDLKDLEIHRNVTSGNLIAARNVLRLIEEGKNLDEFQFEAYRGNSGNDTLDLLFCITRCGFLYYPRVNTFTVEDLNSSGNSFVPTDPDLKKSVYEYYSRLELYDQWMEAKTEAVIRMQEKISYVLDPDERVLVNRTDQEKNEFLKKHEVNVGSILFSIREVDGFKEAVKGIIYIQERLLLESEGREILANELLIRLETALKQ